MAQPIRVLALSATSGNPVPGLSPPPAFTFFQSRSADGSFTDLAPGPVFVDKGGGYYEAQVDDSLLPASTAIVFTVDMTVAASPRIASGELDASSGVILASVVELDDSADTLLRAGDRSPPLTFQLKAADGTPIDLTNGSPTVVFNMRSDQGGALVCAAESCTIVDAPSGRVLFAWPDGTTSMPGDFFYELVLTQSGLQSTFPYGRSGVVRIFPGV